MQPYYKNKYVTLYQADNLDLLPEFKDDEFDLAIPDPPYGQNITKRRQIG